MRRVKIYLLKMLGFTAGIVGHIFDWGGKGLEALCDASLRKAASLERGGPPFLLILFLFTPLFLGGCGMVDNIRLDTSKGVIDYKSNTQVEKESIQEERDRAWDAVETLKKKSQRRVYTAPVEEPTLRYEEVCTGLWPFRKCVQEEVWE